MKRKSLFLFLIIAIVVLAYLYTRPPATVLTIDSVYGVAQVGQTVLINVTLANVPSCSGWLINLLWDPYYVTLTPIVPATKGAVPYAVTEGPFLKHAGPTRGLIFDSVNDAGGQLFVGDQLLTTNASASGTGILISINFTVVHVGTTTLMTVPASPAVNQSIIADARNNLVNHVEVMGLITDEPAPPFWDGLNFQSILIAGDVLVLLAATGIVYLRVHPRPPRSQRRKAELQPIFEPTG